MASKLSPEERIEIVKLYAHHSCRETAAIFNGRHQGRVARLSASTVSDTVNRFNQTGSIHDRKRSGRPRSAVNPDKATDILAQVEANPHSTLRSLSNGSGISHGSVWNILKQYRYHPYKMQILHKLNEDDYPRRVNFCNSFLNFTNRDQDFCSKILWTDESLFSLNGWINKQNFLLVVMTS